MQTIKAICLEPCRPVCQVSSMKIYTGSGDKGKTSLFSGERVPKSHPRIDACGDIDELNSVLAHWRRPFRARI